MYLPFGTHFHLTVDLPQHLAVLGTNSRYFYLLYGTVLPIKCLQFACEIWRFTSFYCCIALYCIAQMDAVINQTNKLNEAQQLKLLSRAYT